MTLLRNGFEDLKLSDRNDNKIFWEKVQQLFCNKVKRNNVITFAVGNELITDNEKLALMFNKSFARAAENLKIASNFSSNLNPNNIDGILLQLEIRNNIDDILQREIHPSIVAAKQKNVCGKFKFYFQEC